MYYFREVPLFEDLLQPLKDINKVNSIGTKLATTDDSKMNNNLKIDDENKQDVSLLSNIRSC